MKDYFTLHLNQTQLRSMSVLALAHIGDGVYELLCRGWLCAHDLETIGNLHKATVSMVCAPAQAAAVKKLLPHLTEPELSYFRRGKNAHSLAAPMAATGREYALATGLETLFGALYLAGETARLNELFHIILEESDGI